MTQRPELEAEVLIVDDEPAIRNGCRRVLSSCGANVEIAANGDEAMELLSSRSFDVAIVDLIMPGKEGLETIAELRRSDADVKIIAISGGGRVNAEDYLHLAKSLGALESLSKPFTREELVESVERLLVKNS